MNKYKIINICEEPELSDIAAEWFHSKWGVPLEAYQESINDSLISDVIVPAWYLCLDDNKIIGGMGVIENDFHDRKDLTPNVCAVYTEKEYRCQGVAGSILNFVCKDMKSKGVDTLYLITDHKDFYERYGWKFLCMVQGDGEPHMSRMYIHREE